MLSTCKRRLNSHGFPPQPEGLRSPQADAPQCLKRLTALAATVESGSQLPQTNWMSAAEVSTCAGLLRLDHVIASFDTGTQGSLILPSQLSSTDLRKLLSSPQHILAAYPSHYSYVGCSCISVPHRSKEELWLLLRADGLRQIQNQGKLQWSRPAGPSTFRARSDTPLREGSRFEPLAIEDDEPLPERSPKPTSSCLAGEFLSMEVHTSPTGQRLPTPLHWEQVTPSDLLAARSASPPQTWMGAPSANSDATPPPAPPNLTPRILSSGATPPLEAHGYIAAPTPTPSSERKPAYSRARPTANDSSQPIRNCIGGLPILSAGGLQGPPCSPTPLPWHPPLDHPPWPPATPVRPPDSTWIVAGPDPTSRASPSIPNSPAHQPGPRPALHSDLRIPVLA